MWDLCICTLEVDWYDGHIGWSLWLRQAFFGPVEKTQGQEKSRITQNSSKKLKVSAKFWKNNYKYKPKQRGKLTVMAVIWLKYVPSF